MSTSYLVHFSAEMMNATTYAAAPSARSHRGKNISLPYWKVQNEQMEK